ncbi:MAG: amidohydrolase family protein, partial [Streptosporangiaceae bacterium]
ITAAIVIGADSGGNDLVAEVVSKVAGASGLVWADPSLPGAVAKTREFLGIEGFCGIKLHPLLDGYPADAPVVWPVAELALEYGVPVLVHCGHAPFSLPWQAERLAARYPQLKMVLGHMGHGTITYIDAAIEAAERHPNIWLETSGMPMGPKIREAVTRVGAARVMFGSDSPCHHPLAEQAKVLAAGLSEQELAWVLHRSAQVVLFPAGTQM